MVSDNDAAAADDADDEDTESEEEFEFNPAVFDVCPPGVNEIHYNYFDSDNDDDHAGMGITV